MGTVEGEKPGRSRTTVHRPGEYLAAEERLQAGINGCGTASELLVVSALVLRGWVEGRNLLGTGQECLCEGFIVLKRGLQVRVVEDVVIKGFVEPVLDQEGRRSTAATGERRHGKRVRILQDRIDCVIHGRYVWPLRRG